MTDTSSDILLSWDFPEYEEYKRPHIWWIWFSVVSLALIVFAVLSANYLFALIIIMVAAIVVFRHYHEPEALKIIIANDGLTIDNQRYRWSDVKSFWLAYEPPEVKNLYLTFKSATKLRVTIPLVEQNPLQVREVLAEYLEEDLEKESEPTSDALGRLLRL